MPLAAPIGSGLGVQNPANLRIMREQLPDATIIVDAGVGTASDAAIAMELGADAVLMNTAVAEARDTAGMAKAMKLAIEAGRLAYLAGRMPKRLYASASSPYPASCAKPLALDIFLLRITHRLSRDQSRNHGGGRSARANRLRSSDRKPARFCVNYPRWQAA